MLVEEEDDDEIRDVSVDRSGQIKRKVSDSEEEGTTKKPKTGDDDDVIEI